MLRKFISLLLCLCLLMTGYALAGSNVPTIPDIEAYGNGAISPIPEKSSTWGADLGHTYIYSGSAADVHDIAYEYINLLTNSYDMREIAHFHQDYGFDYVLYAFRYSGDGPAPRDTAYWENEYYDWYLSNWHVCVYYTQGRPEGEELCVSFYDCNYKDTGERFLSSNRTTTNNDAPVSTPRFDDDDDDDDDDDRRICSACNGSGEIKRNCSSCNGRGTKDCMSCSGKGYDNCSGCYGSGDRRCGRCNGTGDHNDDRCSNCYGDGEVTCSSCNGRGKKDCSACNGSGDRNCSSCYGSGEKEERCSSCGGDGWR